MTDFRWVEKLAPEQYREFHEFYSKEWWTAERTLDDVMHMLAHCDLLLFCLDAESRIAGFARVLSDFTFKALIFDVIVSEKHRRQGRGRLLSNRFSIIRS